MITETEDDDVFVNQRLHKLISMLEKLSNNPQFDSTYEETIDGFRTYIEPLQQQLDSGNAHSINFSEIALFIQSAANCYGRTVDEFYKQFSKWHLDFTISFSQRNQTETENTENRRLELAMRREEIQQRKKRKLEVLNKRAEAMIEAEPGPSEINSNINCDIEMPAERADISLLPEDRCDSGIPAEGSDILISPENIKQEPPSTPVDFQATDKFAEFHRPIFVRMDYVCEPNIFQFPVNMLYKKMDFCLPAHIISSVKGKGAKRKRKRQTEEELEPRNSEEMANLTPLSNRDPSMDSGVYSDAVSNVASDTDCAFMSQMSDSGFCSSRSGCSSSGKYDFITSLPIYCQSKHEEVHACTARCEEMASNITSWRYTLRNKLEPESNTKFDIHEYGTNIINKIGEVDKTVSFSKVVAGESVREVARNFSAILHLANSDNIDIIKTSDSDFDIKLLSQYRHHKIFHSFDGPSELSFRERLENSRPGISCAHSTPKSKYRRVEFEDSPPSPSFSKSLSCHDESNE